MYTKKDIQFSAGEIILRGWLYAPKHYSNAPCVVMAHGFSALKEHCLDKFAVRFAEQGMCALVYDNRNFGDSDGLPRQEVDPHAQIQDMKNAVTFVRELEGIDPQKIGLWGTSFSGGVVLMVAGTDKRVACAVAQVPFISGHHKALRANKPEQLEKMKRKYEADRLARSAGSPPAMVQVVTDDPEKPAIMKLPSAYSFFTGVASWKNEVTLKSLENSGDFEPIAVIKQISPMPILFIVADNDTVNATDMTLQAYAEAHEPKKLVMIKGDHFAPYDEQFDICVNAAGAWFATHLIDKTNFIAATA
jgi:uncharacterized protein